MSGIASRALPARVVDDAAGTIETKELAARVERVAAGLAARGVGRGDRVVLSLPSSLEFVVCHLALDRLAAVTVNLPASFRREVGQVVRLSDARLAILSRADDRRLYGDLREFVALEPGKDALSPLEGGDEAPPLVEGAPDDVVWLAFTSGATGTPRAAVHTRASLAASVEAMAARYGLGPEDTIFVGAPVGHAIGFCYGVRLASACGAGLVLQRRWDAEQALETVAATGCTFAAVPTPFLADIVELGRECGALRPLLVGGAPVPRDQLVEADRLLGHGVASAYYGSSECGAVLTCPADGSDELRLATDGFAMAGMEIRIVDAEGNEAGDGELHVRGPQVARGYWANNDSDHQFLPDGWFATRDRARRDATTGGVAITGRFKELIIRGAVNVVPYEVEEALAGHPAIGWAAVFGVPDRRLGERILAVITAPGKAPTLEEVRAWLQECGLARPKWPDELSVVPEFPRNAAGKVDRARLRDETLARLAG